MNTKSEIDVRPRVNKSTLSNLPINSNKSKITKSFSHSSYDKLNHFKKGYKYKWYNDSSNIKDNKNDNLNLSFHSKSLNQLSNVECAEPYVFSDFHTQKSSFKIHTNFDKQLLYSKNLDRNTTNKIVTSMKKPLRNFPMENNLSQKLAGSAKDDSAYKIISKRKIIKHPNISSTKEAQKIILSSKREQNVKTGTGYTTDKSMSVSNAPTINTRFQKKYQIMSGNPVNVNKLPTEKKFPFKRNPPIRYSISKQVNAVTKQKIFFKKPKALFSDKFVNISGQMYLSTRNSLQKSNLVNRKSSNTPSMKVTNKYMNIAKSPRRPFIPISYSLLEILKRKRRRALTRRRKMCVYQKYGRCRYRNKGCPYRHEPSPSGKSSLRRKSLKSYKFVNISGKMYRSTKTSLTKHDGTRKNHLKNRIRVSDSGCSFVNSSRARSRRHYGSLASGTLIEIVRRKKMTRWKRVAEFCFFFNKYGRCRANAGRCPFVHDPNRVSVCTRYVLGSCAVKDCPFLHTRDKDRMPVCSHYVEGHCSRPNCPFRHVRVNPKAPFCRSFLQGHCADGEECKKKHILICEDYKEGGTCPRGKGCPLSHKKPKNPKKTRTPGDASKRKRKPKRRSRIGVLGLTPTSTNAKNPGNLKKSANVPVSRYFDSRPGEEVSTSETIPASLSSQEESNPSSSPVSNSLERTRERLLAKVERLKKLYNNQSLGSPPNIPRTPLPETSSGQGGAFPPVDQSAIGSSPRVEVLPRVPLSSDLPAFIPLRFPDLEG